MFKSMNRMVGLKSEIGYIVTSIEGNIACGKSTILDYITSKNNRNFQCLQEPVAEWTNMSSGMDLLKLFYEETDKWSFSFENLVQLSRLKSLYESQSFAKSRPPLIDSNNSQRIARMDGRIFLERSILSSYNVFVNNSFEEKRLNKVEYDVLTKYYNFFTQKANKLVYVNETMKENEHKSLIPYQIVYIRTSPEVSFHRLQKRARESERNIGLDYLQKINEKYENWIEQISKENADSVRIIDGNRDKAYVIDQIDSILNE